MHAYNIKTKEELLDLVGASGPDPSDPGPVVVHAILWDGRVVKATYYKGPKWDNPDAESEEIIFYNLLPLVPFVDRMLEKNESFVTITGTDDQVCALEWFIKK